VEVVVNGVIAHRVRQTLLHCGRGLLRAAVAPAGIPLALPAALVAGGIVGILVSPWIWLLSHGHPVYWLISVPLGIVCLPMGIMAGPSTLRSHAPFTQSLLAPTRRAMAERVRELTESRSEAVDASAAELRRIEHDLHDGPQARLASLGLTIGLAERMVKQDPDAAMALLAEARLSSGQALAQLRDVVRGICPPVLAERGLGDAVRALALTLPVPVDVYVDMPGRAAPPVESAVYFAIAEMLANAVKHSSASSAWVQLQYDGDRLFGVVGDNGVGGAVVMSTGGLRGVERRLAVFDGAITVMSLPGGPTMITMELACELSSVKISPCCEMA
jgi:signal transduction histidine kinase